MPFTSFSSYITLCGSMREVGNVSLRVVCTYVYSRYAHTHIGLEFKLAYISFTLWSYSC